MHLVGVEDYENKLIFVLKRRDFKIYIPSHTVVKKWGHCVVCTISTKLKQNFVKSFYRNIFREIDLTKFQSTVASVN